MRSRLQWIALALALILVAGILAYYCVGIRGMWYPRSYVVSLGDLDGDGDLDALVGNGHTDDTGSSNTVWLNDGTGRFADGGQRLGQKHEHSAAVALGDLDGDGDLDALFGNESPDTVWLNEGAGQFGEFGQFRTMPKLKGYMVSKAVTLGDVDGDGDLDVFVGSCCRGEYGSSEPGTGYVRRGYGDSPNTVWLNDGRGRFTDSGQLLGNESTLAVALGDVDGDGDLDAFVGNKRDSFDAAVSSPANEVWLNDGQGRFTDSGQGLGGANSHAVALGDVDGDGDLDAFVGNDDPRTLGQVNKVWVNDGSGRFAEGGQVLGNSHTRVVALVDADSDGDLDAFMSNHTASRIGLNDGAGRFTDSGQRLSHARGYVVNIGDVDGDGDADVFATHYNKGYRVWYNNVGRFYRADLWRNGRYWLAGGACVVAMGLFGWWTVQYKCRC
jgi:hypothetical protein